MPEKNEVILNISCPTSLYRRASFSRATGMTLFELLFAMAISVLVMTILFASYRSVLFTMRVQSEGRSFRSSAGAAMDLIKRDIVRVIAPGIFTNASLIVETKTNGYASSRLSLVSTKPVSTADMSFYDVICVQYTLEDKGPANGYTLIRQKHGLRTDSGTPDDPVQETLAKNIRRFLIELFDGTNWTRSWGMDDNTNLPLVARITIEQDGKESIALKSETIIPAGHRFPDRK